ncbi:MAG: Tfp pilus assembly ATPase PilU, partial [Pseudohongiellaceae bacterium]
MTKNNVNNQCNNLQTPEITDKSRANIMGFNDLLKMMIEKDGSDLFLTTGAAPSIKAFGKLFPLIDKKLPEGMVKKIAYQIMNEE